MPGNGTIEKLDGKITGELSKVREVTGRLSAPKARDVPGDYEKLTNHPFINDEEVVGNKTFEDYGDHTLSNIEIKAIFDRVFTGGN